MKLLFSGFAAITTSLLSYWQPALWLGLFLVLSGCPSVQNTRPTIPEFDYLPASSRSTVIEHTHFVLGYTEAHEQSEWVAYELTPAEVRVSLPRDGSFRADPDVSTGSASPDDYRGSGYDRGHLAPVGDMNFDPIAMDESFLMSNISPQKRSFNAGIWRRLENQVRDWAVAYEGLHVITGPVLGSAVHTIGENRVTVPDFFYKVLLCKQGDSIRMIGLVLPNRASDGNLRDFVEKVDNIEAYTGIDFFPALPDSLEDKLEREVSLEGWFSE